MARPRSIQNVQEDFRRLRSLEQQHRGTPLSLRLRMLILLKEDPSRTYAELSDRLGCSSRCLQRWVELYRDGGLEGLLAVGQRGRPRRLEEQGVEQLRTKLRDEGFDGLEHVQQWLHQEHGVEYSRSGLWYLLRRSMKARPSGWLLFDEETELERLAHIRAVNTQAGLAGPAVAFLNALPTSGDILEWGPAYKSALITLLGDVDRISLNVNLNCDLIAPERYEYSATITQHFFAGGREGREGREVDIVAPRAGTRSAQLLEEARLKGFPLQEFHPPHCFDYYYRGQAYLGTVFLWREVRNPPIGKATVDLVTALEPFQVFALSDVVARHQAMRPIDGVFHEALAKMAEDARLTPQEQRIVILQLLGHSYKDMADILSVAVDTVKKHFKQIHRKTETRGQAELFAKYFTSRMQAVEGD